MKLYFKDSDDEMCYPESYFQWYMKHNEIEKITVAPARRVVGSDYFYCKIAGEVGEKGHCGECPDYTPLNGVKGICRWNKPVYEPKAEQITLKLKI